MDLWGEGYVLIPRLFYFDTRFYSKEYVRVSGLDMFMGLEMGRELVRYKLVFYGLIAQEEGSHILHLIVPGEKIMFVENYVEYCRWHNGPLERKDNPLEREYCVREAVSELGYCSKHRNSIRAIYSKCFSTAGLESLRNCWILDEKYKDKINYTVYLLAYNKDKFKVGTTRTWRLLDRIAEQPHIVATTLYTSNSAVETRNIEIKAGKLEGLTEKPHRKLKETIKTPIPPVLLKLEKTLTKTQRILGIKQTKQPTIFRIEPNTEITEYHKAKETNLKQIIGKQLIIQDYYAGHLLLEETNTNTKYLLKTNQILHKPSIKTT